MELTTLLVLVALLLVFLAGGLWICIALIAVGVVAMHLFLDVTVGQIMASTIWSASTSWSLIALPLFIWMGEILYRTRITDELFAGVAPWVTAFPGQLLHVNVIGSGVFAAVSGSSTATAAAISRVSVPELRSRGYDEKMIIGTLAGSGTLGLLIPPSVMMIVYGVIADVSIARLFIAGILPGILVMTLFMGYIALWSLANPGRQPAPQPRIPFAARVRASRGLIPVAGLILAVLGSIYAGLATATEAAALGVTGALVLAVAQRALTLKGLVDSLISATLTSCMIALILAAAAFLTVATGFIGLPEFLSESIGAMELSRGQLLAALVALYIVLGCFLDGISMVALTASAVLPAVAAAGMDPLWFGVFVVLLVEMSLVTPPVGLNLFVLQGLAGRDLGFVARSTLPFFGLLLVALLLITVFPGVVTALPEAMMAKR